MNLIYKPKGKANEYTGDNGLGVNLYKGCSGGCWYCYNRLFNENYNIITPKKDCIETLKLNAIKYYNHQSPIFMSFATDPYNDLNQELNLTRQALEIFLKNKIPVIILTKYLKRALVDLDIFKKFGTHIKIGTTLVFDNDNDCGHLGCTVDTIIDRVKTLEFLYNQGINTWVSCEPVLYSKQIVNIIKWTYKFVNEYRIGLLSNKVKLEDTRYSIDFDRPKFLTKLVSILRYRKKPFYIKHSLQLYDLTNILRNNEKNLNLNLPEPFELEKMQLF